MFVETIWKTLSGGLLTKCIVETNPVVKSIIITY